MDRSLILHPRQQRRSLLGRRGQIQPTQPLKVPPSPVLKTGSFLGKNPKTCAVSTITAIDYDCKEYRMDPPKVLQDHTNKPFTKVNTTKNKNLDVSVFKTYAEPKEPTCRSFDFEEFLKLKYDQDTKRDTTIGPISTARSLFGNENKFDPADSGIIPLSPYENKKEELVVPSEVITNPIDVKSPNDSFVEHETIIGSLDFSPLDSTLALDKTLMNQSNTPNSCILKRQLSSGKKRTLRKSLSLYKNVLNNTQMNAALCMITEEEEENSDNKLTNILNVVDKMITKQNAIERKLMEDLDEVKKQKEDMIKLKEMMGDMLKDNNKKSNNSNSNIKSPDNTSQKVLRDIRTSISFLKTPRALESCSPDLRTPHSMSFCVQDQYEKLLLHK